MDLAHFPLVLIAQTTMEASFWKRLKSFRIHAFGVVQSLQPQLLFRAPAVVQHATTLDLRFGNMKCHF